MSRVKYFFRFIGGAMLLAPLGFLVAHVSKQIGWHTMLVGGGLSLAVIAWMGIGVFLATKD